MDADAGIALAAVADQHMQRQGVGALPLQQAGDICERKHRKAQIRRMGVAAENVRVGVEHILPIHEDLDVIVPVHSLQTGIGDRIR